MDAANNCFFPANTVSNNYSTIFRTVLMVLSLKAYTFYSISTDRKHF